MKSPKVRRLFIAIDLSEELILHLGEIKKIFHDQGLLKIRWVRPQNRHLTLKFLGDTSESLVHSINSSVSMATSRVRPFGLQIHGLGAFPHLRAPRTLWLGIHGDLQSLVHIKGRLECTLEAQGFPRDQTTFSPHVTLGRINRRLSFKERESLKQVAVKLQKLAPQDIVASKLSLIESRLNQNGPDFVQVQEHRLSG